MLRSRQAAFDNSNEDLGRPLTTDKGLPQGTETMERIRASGNLDEPSLAGRLRIVLFSRRSVLYVVGLLLTALVTFLVSSDAFGIPPLLHVPLIECFSVLAILAWISVAYWIAGSSDVGLVTLVVGIGFAAVAAMFLESTSGIRPHAFWPCLVIWTAIAVLSVTDASSGDAWERLLLGLGVAWTVSMALIFAGTTRLLPYAVGPIANLKAVHRLLDVRYLLGILFVVLLLATAAVEAFRARLPRWPSMTPLRIPATEGSELLDLLLAPFVMIVNIALLVFSVVLDMLIKAAKAVAFYFGQVGRQAGALLQRMFREVVAIRRTLRVLGAVATSVVLCLTSPNLRIRAV